MVAPPTSSDHATTDFGVKIPSQDFWLSASTGDRVGPQLLEDSIGREKARHRSSLFYVQKSLIFL